MKEESNIEGSRLISLGHFMARMQGQETDG